MKLTLGIPPSSPSEVSRKGDNKRLTAIVGQIKALEKRTIAHVVDIGRLLEQASELIESGEYMDWLKANFGWSHSTSLRYRAIYWLSRNRQIGDFDKLNMSVSAFYLLANNIDHTPVRDALVAAAMAGRVSYSTARQIVEDIKKKLAAAVPVEPEPEPELEPEPEPELSHDADGDADGDDADDDADDDAGGDDIDDDDKTPSASEPVKTSPAAKPLPDKADDGILTILLRHLHTRLRDRAAEAGIKLAIAEMGSVQIHEIVERLKAALNEYSNTNATKAIADRIEAKSRTASTSDFPDIPANLDRRKLN